MADAAPDAVSVVVRQAVRATFRSLIAERATIMRVDAGTKRVRGAFGASRTGAGSLGLLPANVALEVENVPPAGGPYVARALLVPHAAAEGLRASTPTAESPDAEGVRDPRALAAFERAAAAARDPSVPPALRGHLVREVLLWLAETGLRLPSAGPPRLADEVRARLARDPAAPWRAETLAAALAVSSPTLRRRLAAEGTSFAALLVDVRMTRALAPLQTSDRPIALVGEAVGYASPSRFVARFRARFGVTPARLRRGDVRETLPMNAPTRRVERDGTGSDRIGTPAPDGSDDPVVLPAPTPPS